MSECNIVIISDNIDFSNNLAAKIVLLRSVDKVLASKYSEIFEILEGNIPDVIILDGDDERNALEFLSKIQFDSLLKNVPSILFASDYNEDLFLSAFDVGLEDYVLKSVADAEILMRIIWAIKHGQKTRKLEAKNKLLSELEVLSIDNDIYKSKYCSVVFENEVKLLSKYNQFSSFMVIAPDINCRQKLTTSLLGSIIKKCVRDNDIVGYADNYKFYVLLANTNIRGLFIVYEKIKEALTSEYSISVGASEIKDGNFTDTEKSVNKALEEALAVGNSIIIADNKSVKNDNWLDRVNNTPKNFKLFKQAFIKKFNNVIIPVFYQVQKAYEEKLFETKINQSCNETESSFELIGKTGKAMLKISYPGFSKINIDIEYSFQKKPERVTLGLNELSDSSLAKILKDFIEKYRKNTNLELEKIED